VRELNTYCEIVAYNKFPFGDESVKGVILSGSPFSVNDDKAFKTDLSEIRGKYPVLGICYGAQLIALTSGGEVGKPIPESMGVHICIRMIMMIPLEICLQTVRSGCHMAIPS